MQEIPNKARNNGPKGLLLKKASGLAALKTFEKGSFAVIKVYILIAAKPIKITRPYL